jgi:predicted AAA+ superfamily ATPase
MYNRILTLPLNEKHSLFLFGPRGVGKTTWLRTLLPDAIYIDLLEFELYSLLQANPGRLESLIPVGYQEWIIIDEVQRVPELLNEVHRLIESKHYRFILTGSSARQLRSKGVNLLAGRALRHYMHPLTLQELGADFSLTRSLQYGLLPTAITSKNPESYLKTYVETYLREEVMQEGLTRNMGAFSRFLEIASFSQGSLVNFSEIAREVHVDRQVITNYFSILDDLLLAYRLPPFTKRAKRRLITHQKFYFFDVGVYRFLRPMGILDTPQEAEGAALETLFLQSFRALNDYYQWGYKIYFWRTSHGQEVDFVVYGERGFYAFEIKRAQTVHSKDLNGLRMFLQDYPEAKAFLLYTGTMRAWEHENAIQILPIEMALRELASLI